MILSPQKNSEAVVEFLRADDSCGSAFSIDVEDLFYSVPHAQMFKAVRKCIEFNGEVAFQNAAGVTVDSFLALLEFCLSATFISYEDGTYLQKQGICIGSCVAPVLCNIFLSDVDRALHDVLDTDVFAKVFRYVDDFLVLLRKRPGITYDEAIADVLKAFEVQGEGLTFTLEFISNNLMQF